MNKPTSSFIGSFNDVFLSIGKDRRQHNALKILSILLGASHVGREIPCHMGGRLLQIELFSGSVLVQGMVKTCNDPQNGNRKQQQITI